MREALHDLPIATQLHTDFYDRDRLATWANEYPGIAAWVRQRVGRPLSGWSSIGDWVGCTVSEKAPYLFDNSTCLTDERSRDLEQITIIDGVTRLRAALRTPQQCIRLIGLSGLGKTRLVEALFESGLGDEPLDPSLAVYTDYSQETDPTARDMARMLIARQQKAILIVDNCNPATHAELARLCSDKSSTISLITVEYDVRDDEPEWTEVFRLQSASPELVAKWLDQSFPGISQLDGQRIAEFSDGNFRIARALADTLDKDETLGRLRSRDLFVRIFQQRNDPDQQLLHAAEDLALLYSINGEDTSSTGELSTVGSIRGIGTSQLYAALTELRRRGVVQARGRWRAVLPQAIANPLASYSLERITSDDFDEFSAKLTPRMLRSLSRRLGFLHDSKEAQAVVERWLRVNGPLGNLTSRGDDGLTVVANIAPVAPDAVLIKLKSELDGLGGPEILEPNNDQRSRWIRLIKSLAYDESMFEPAMTLLARFFMAEPPEHNRNSARGAFAELFHLHLSGTRATPEQRRAAIRHLAHSKDPAMRRCASTAIDALLEANHFTATGDSDFGARSRDWGWHPKVNKDVWEWYDESIGLVTELVPVLTDARNILARNVSGLWKYCACHDALDNAATELIKTEPWIEGWLAFRSILRFDGEDMPSDNRERLKNIIARLSPPDLLHQARAVVLNRTDVGLDVADGEPDEGDVMTPWHLASNMAHDVGRALANDTLVRQQFLAELIIDAQAPRAYECGRGLAEGADNLIAIWNELVECYCVANPSLRNATVLGGFLYGAHQRDRAFTGLVLEAAMDEPDVVPVLPYLQARIAIDERGISRLRRAITKGVLSADNFRHIANGVVCDAPPDALAELLDDLSSLSEGVEVALDILHIYFHRKRDGEKEFSHKLILTGRDLLGRADFTKTGALRDYGLRTVIRICLAGKDAQDSARRVSVNVRSALENVQVSLRDLGYVLKALLETQPFVALDQLLLAESSGQRRHLFSANTAFATPIEDLDAALLCQWADVDPQHRYPLLGQCLSMFSRKDHKESSNLSPLFLAILDHAPDKQRYLGGFWQRLHPWSWSGSLADILIQRKSQALQLIQHHSADVRQWVTDMLPELDRWIENERSRDREGEESFE